MKMSMKKNQRTFYSHPPKHMLSLASLDIYIRPRQYMLEIYRYNTDNITIFINIVVKCKYTTFYHIGKTLIKRIHSLIQPAAKRKQKVF